MSATFETPFAEYTNIQANKYLKNPRDLVQESLFAPQEVLPELSAESIRDEADQIAGTWNVVKQPYSGEQFDNAKTAIYEALTARGHLSHLEYEGSIEEVSAIMIQRVVNYLNLPLHPHERERALAELREMVLLKRTAQAMLDGKLSANVEVATESIFPVGLDDETANSLGYRASNRKGMLRTTSFDLLDDGKIRWKIDQLSYSDLGSAIWRYGDDVSILNQPQFYDRSYMPDGIVDYAKALDFGQGDKMYGARPDETTIAYDDLRGVSEYREEILKHFAEELADFEKQSPDDEEGYLKKLQEIVRRICVQHPSYTRDALGEDVVDDYNLANQQYSRGDYDSAAQSVTNAAGREVTIVICGGSITSVSNEQAANMTESEVRALEQKLKEDAEKLVWVSGKCRVEGCPTDGKTTEVAQCSVCRGCQAIFDDGKDPAKIYQEQRLKAEKQRETSAKKAKMGRGMSSLIRKFVTGRDMSSLIKKFVWGNGAFSPVEEVIGWDGKVIAEGEDARRMYREYYDLAA